MISIQPTGKRIILNSPPITYIKIPQYLSGYDLDNPFIPVYLVSKINIMEVSYARQEPDLSALLQELPPFVPRNIPAIQRTDWLFRHGTLANMDCSVNKVSEKRIMLG